MNEYKDDFDKLVDNVGDRLSGESLEVVIPALTTLLANAGLMSGVKYTTFITFVLESITDVYKRHKEEIDNQTFH